MVTWRDSASEQAQADLDGLLNIVLPFAEQTLARHGAMLPFGAAVSADGDVELLAGDPGDQRPEAGVLLELLYDGARATAAGRRAFAFAADVRANGGDAVRVELEHREGQAIVVVAPYARARLTKKITFGQISAGSGNPRIWAEH